MARRDGRRRGCSPSSSGFLALRYRLKGAYFALATFAFAEMLRLFATNSDLVNRAVGYNVPAAARDTSWWYMQFEAGSPNYFWIALGPDRRWRSS